MANDTVGAPYSPREIQIMREGRRSGRSAREIVSLLAEEGFFRTRVSVIGKCYREGIGLDRKDHRTDGVYKSPGVAINAGNPRRGKCQYIHGDVPKYPQEPNWCEKRSVEGRSYCEEHYKLTTDPRYRKR